MPAEGLCLSAFLIVRDRTDPTKVLLGKMDPAGPWEELAAVDAERMERLRNSWVLPASQLLRYESPREAAARLASELLDLPSLEIKGPRVESEAYARGPDRGPEKHWDVHFLFEATLSEGDLRPNPIWSELRFLRVSEVPRALIGRGHADILAFYGLEAR